MVYTSLEHTHRDLFHAVLPDTARYYQEISEHIVRDPATIDPEERQEIDEWLYDGCGDPDCATPLSSGDKVLRWLYYQASPHKRAKLPPLVLRCEPPNTQRRWRDHNKAALELDTYSQQACCLLVEIDMDAVPAQHTLQLAQTFCRGFPKNVLDIVNASQTGHALSLKLIEAGATDTHLLEIVTQVAQTLTAQSSGAMILAAVQSAVRRLAEGGASVGTAPVKDLEEQLTHMLDAGILLESAAYDQEALLAIVAKAFAASARGAKVPQLHLIFLLLVKLGAKSLGSMGNMVRYWHLVVGGIGELSCTAGDKHPFDAATKVHQVLADWKETNWRLAWDGDIGKLSCTAGDKHLFDAATKVHQVLADWKDTNWRLAWEMSLSHLLMSEPDPSQSDLQTADGGLCRIAVGLDQLVVNGVFKRGNATGRSTVGCLVGGMGCDIHLKCRPELPGVELMVRELARSIFGKNAAPWAVLARWNRNDITGIGEDDPVLLSQGVSGPTLQAVFKNPAEKAAVLTNLDPASFSKTAILAMLTMPEDGKPDNYICNKLPNGAFQLVCIDNDHSFAPASTERGLHVHFNVKCILFCLDVMHDTIDESTRSAFLEATGGHSKNDVFGVLKRWLEVMSDTCSQHDTLFDGSPRSAAMLWKRNMVRCVCARVRACARVCGGCRPLPQWCVRTTRVGLCKFTHFLPNIL